MTQGRHYSILPANKANAKDFVLTKVHLAHKLVQEAVQSTTPAISRANGSERQPTGIYPGNPFDLRPIETAGGQRPGQNRTVDAISMNFDKLSDLPGPAAGQSSEGRVVLTVEPAHMQGASALGRAGSFIGPFQTVAQAGGHLH